MVHGKILKFVKDHWFGLLSVSVVCVAVLYCIYSCSITPTLNVITKGNRVRVESLNK